MDDFDIDIDAEIDYEEELRDEMERELIRSPKRQRIAVPGVSQAGDGVAIASGERQGGSPGRSGLAGSPSELPGAQGETQAHIVVDAEGEAEEEEADMVAFEQEPTVFFSEDPDVFGAGAQTGRFVDEGLEAFFRIRRREEYEDELERCALMGTVLDRGNGLLGRPFDEVLRLANDDLERRRAPPDSEQSASTRRDPGKYLWVDKYKPRRFVELLSQEAINRSVLWWLKAWSLAGTREGKALYDEQQRKLRLEQQQEKEQAERGFAGHSAQDAFRAGGQRERNSGWRDRPWFKSNLRTGGRVVGRDLTALSLGEVPVEADGRPVKKALLLAGPPGCGKSTLAFVAATSAGYHPLEINASDDRTAKKMTRLIKMATNQATSFHKPNCIILDEIDGADGADALASVARLISPTKAPKSKGKPAEAPRSIPRPVLCICNNVYAPALKSFKSYCHVLVLREVQKQALIDRLRRICTREGLSLDRGVLGALADVGDGDIRSCLHTLQFLLRTSGELTEEAVMAAGGVGQKDLTQSLFDLWERTFHHFPRRKRKRGAASRGIAATPSSQLKGDLLRCDDTELLISGLHENYLGVTFSDPQLDSTVKLTEWLSVNDRWDNTRRSLQAWAMSRYSQFVPLVFHEKCESRDTRFPQLMFPRSNQQLRRDIELNETYLLKVFDSIRPELRSYYCKLALNADVVPSLVAILGGHVRVASPDLLSPSEKWHLKTTIDAHIAYGISYTEVVSEETGEPKIVFDPPLHNIYRFRFEMPSGHGYGPGGHSTPTERQFLRHQITTQLLRLSASARPTSLRGAASEPVTKRSGKGGSGDAAKARGVAKKRQRVNMTDFIAEKAAHQDSRDSAAQLGAASKTHFRTQFPVRFKFHEGFTNAVRRPLYVSDFL